jgi:hypothetical protein
MNTRALLTLTAAALAAACSSTSTPIGDYTPAGASGSQTGAAGASAPAATGTGGQTNYVPSPTQILTDPPFDNPSGVADWVGYFENLQFMSGSDAIKLHFGVDAAGHTTLSVVLGMGPPPPPPTDPFQGWPDPVFDKANGQIAAFGYPSTPIEGFTYSAHEVTWQGSRLKFTLVMSEPWAPWCALQPSFMLGPNWWSCNAGTGSASQGDTCVYTDNPTARCTSAHLFMCLQNICACNATGCGADVNTRTPYDITFYGEHADGSAMTHTLRLMPVIP